MNITNDINNSIENLSEEELDAIVKKARYEIFALYERYTRGDVEDFLRGGCAIFANMLYNLFPNDATVYCSDHHAVTKIGNHFYDADDCTRDEDMLEAIKNGVFSECNLKTKEGRDYFYFFSDSCLYSDTGRYGETIERIVNEVKSNLGLTYSTSDDSKLLLTIN